MIDEVFENKMNDLLDGGDVFFESEDEASVTNNDRPFPYNLNHEYQEEDEPVWLTEEDELVAAYGRANLEFVRDQHWVDDSLEHYFGEYK